MKSLAIKTFIFFLCFGIFSRVCFTPCFGQGRPEKFGLGMKDIISSDALVIGGRYWFSERLSVDGNLGFRYFSPDKGEDSKRFLLGGGINQYLLPEETFSPFVGVDFSFEVNDPGKDNTITTFNLDGKFGGEYFFTERFSLSGAVLFGLRFGDETEIGTDGRLGVLYYLN